MPVRKELVSEPAGGKSGGFAKLDAKYTQSKSTSTQFLANVLRNGGNPNFMSNEDKGEKRSLLLLAIQEALQTDDWEKVDLLLEFPQTNPSLRYEKTGENCLDLAMAARNFELCRKLIKHKPEIAHECTKKKVSPLHTAVFKDDMELVTLLLFYKVNVNAAEQLGQTPIFFANSEEMCDLLAAHGADIFHISIKQQTALHVAAIGGNNDLARWILDKAPSMVNLADEFGRTPLHLAAGRGHESTAKILLDAGADMMAKTTKGKLNPMEFADKNKQESMAYYLYVRYTGSSYAPWHMRVKNPPFLFTIAILFVACVLSREILNEFFWDWVHGWKYRLGWL